MRAAQEGHVQVVAALLNAGGDVNKRNHERMNALMLASQRGHDGIVSLLIKQGADIDCQTVQGSTALMLACKRQHEAVVRVLLTAGAEMFVKDSRGRTARDTALKRNHKPIIAMLQASRQVRLMQTEARVHRAYLLVKLYELNGAKRAFPVPDLVSSLALKERQYQQRRAREEEQRQRRRAQEQQGKGKGIEEGVGVGVGKVRLEEEEEGEEEGMEGDDEEEGPRAGTRRSQETLCRALELPFPLFRHIERFLPWPRMWGPLLPILHKRCHVDANEALRGALSIMDEVLTDLGVSNDPVQEMHLVRAACSPSIRACLWGKHGMPPDMVASIVRWNDAQSILARFERGVTFSPLVADRAVKDAARLYHWVGLGGDEPDSEREGGGGGGGGGGEGGGGG